jgi:hypothetical protein
MFAAVKTPTSRASCPINQTSSKSEEGYALQLAPKGAPSREMICGCSGKASPSAAAAIRARISKVSPR